MSSVFGIQFDEGPPLKGIGSEHLRDRLILPSHLSPTIFGAVGAISVIDPDDPAAAGSTGLIADAGHQHAWTTGAASTLARTETNTEGSSPSGARADHGHDTKNMAWGTLKSQVLTSNSTGFTTSATTDFALSTVPVLNDRDYVIYLSSLVNRSANGDWQINVHVGGTLLNEIGREGDNATGTSKKLYGIIYKPGSSGNVDLDIRVVEVSGAATFTFLGGANAERHFWIEDKGPRT